MLRTPASVALAAAVVSLCSSPARADNFGAWKVGQDMNEQRMSPPRVVLLDGRVMVIGGFNDSYGAGNTVEIYDPYADTWTYAAPVPRAHTGPGFAALLPSGEVLYTGGLYIDDSVSGPTDDNVYDGSPLSFIFDPWGKTKMPDGSTAPGSWRPTGSLPSSTFGDGTVNQRAIYTEGTVVIAGGLSDDSFDSLPAYAGSHHSFVYEERTGKWSNAGELAQGRAHVPLSRLTDGRVLVAGGRSLFFTGGAEIYANDVEIYDPAKRAWKVARELLPVVPSEEGIGCLHPDQGACNNTNPGSRWGHVQLVLRDGRVLIAGGVYSDAQGNWNARASAFFFDPYRETFKRVKHDMPVALFMGIARQLPDGRVYVGAGQTAPDYLDGYQGWFFDPDQETWTDAPDLPCIALDPVVTDYYGVPAGTTSLPNSTYNLQSGVSLLEDGRMVISGGFTNEVVDGFWDNFSKRTFVYDPFKRTPRAAQCAPSHL